MKIVFLDIYTLNSGNDLDLQPLKALGDLEAYDETASDQIVGRCRGAEIVISNKVKIREEHMAQLPELKHILVAATGYDNIDLEAARNRDITVSNIVGYSSSSVAQHAFALILNYLNKVSRYTSQTERWAKQNHFSFRDHTTVELKGKTMGILGPGEIGQQVASIALAFGMKVLATSSSKTSGTKDGIEYVDRDRLFGQSDFLSLHAPLNPETRHIINEDSLQKMKSTAVLVNTARGQLIDEKALRESLISGRPAAALLDVLSQEPPPSDHILLDCPKCYITPHQAWASLEARRKLLDGLVDNIKAYRSGNPPDVVN